MSTIVARMLGFAVITCLVFAGGAALAVQNGELDGESHQAVAYMFGSNLDPLCEFVYVGCSAVLVSPTVAIASADCAVRTASEAQWLSFEAERAYVCENLVRISQRHIHPGYQFGIGPPELNIAVLILETPVLQTPAELPVAGRLEGLGGGGDLIRGGPQEETFTVSGMGTTQKGPGSGFALGSLARRHAPGIQLALDPSFVTVRLKGTHRPCINWINEGTGAFLGGSNELLALALHTQDTCATTESFLRLDSQPVRDFLDDFLTLP